MPAQHRIVVPGRDPRIQTPCGARAIDHAGPHLAHGELLECTQLAPGDTKDDFIQPDADQALYRAKSKPDGTGSRSVEADYRKPV